MAVLDFDNFPSDAKEQLALIRFRLRKSVPFDVESAAISYFVQPAEGKKFDVVVVVAPLEVVSRYEAPFRAAGMNPGLVTTSSLAALNLDRGWRHHRGGQGHRTGAHRDGARATAG